MSVPEGPVHGDFADVVGRAAELSALRRLITAADPRARALLLEGEPGVGKTTLWRAARAMASEASVPVLAATAAETEADLPLVGLADLLASAHDHEPVPGTAAGSRDELMRLVTSDEPGDPRVIGRRLLELLGGWTTSGPVLLAVDDAQWLDAASERALSFAIRRLADRPLRILLARRTDDRPPPFDLERVLAERLSRLPLGFLDASTLDELLRRRLDVRLPRPRLVDLHAISHGNPLFALEIVGAAIREGRRLDVDPFVVPGNLAQLVLADTQGLGAEGRLALLIAATSGPIAADLLEQAAGGRAGIREALASGGLQLTGDRIAVRHPILASVVRDAALPAERRDAHRRLAEHLVDRVDRARHLAQAAIEADEAIAAELDAAAAIAAERGSPALGAELSEHAARLTPPGDEVAARRRMFKAAEHRVAAGDPARARATLEDLLDGLTSGLERARILLLLADSVGDDLPRSIALAEEALADAAGEPAMAAEIHTALGVFTWLAGDLARATEHTRASAALAEESGDERLLAIAIGEVCHADAVLGRPWNATALERALEIERRLGDFPPWLRPSFQKAIILTYTDRPDDARPLVLSELERVRASGDEAGRVGVLFRLAELELRAGNWAAAAAAADEAARLAASAGIEQEQTTATIMHAVVMAHLGRLDDARDAGRRGAAEADAMGDRINGIRARGALGLAEVAAARPAEALAWLEPAHDELERLGIAEQSIAAVPENLIDALVSSGRLDEAAVVAERLAELGRPAGRAWHAAVAARGLALVAIGRGDTDEADRRIADAYEAHQALPNPFTLGRTHLAAGVVARRARRWADARAAFAAALDVFDRLGASRWAERAGTEVARLPGRPPAGDGLTATEHQVARFVAAGLTNKEIAGRLSVTTRTVEQHVSRIYTKLGVASRAELATRLASQDGA